MNGTIGFLQSSNGVMLKTIHLLRTSLFLLILFSLTSCGQSELSLLDKAQSEMDQRHYRQAIELLEQASQDRTGPELNTKLAYAYLGAAGVEFSDLAKNVQSLQRFDHHHLSLNSLPLIQLANMPSPENADLVHAFELFDRAYPDVAHAPQEINLLIAALKFTLSIEYYNRLVSIHETTEVARATATIVNVKHSLLSLFDGLHRLYFSYGKIKRFLTAAEAKPLLKIGSFSYYLSENISLTNFFDFLTHSTEITLEDGIERAANDPRGLGEFLSRISQKLVWLRTHTEADDTAVSALTSQLIEISSRIAPKSISLKPTLDRVALAPVRIKDAQLPHFMRRMIHAVNEAWEIENAQVLFDERDHLRVSIEKLKQIAVDWDAVPETFNQTMPAWLVTKTEEDLKEFISLEINPSSADSLASVTRYYTILKNTLTLWTTDPNATQAEAVLSSDVRNLIQKTDEWITENL